MTVALCLMNTTFNEEIKDNNNQWLLILIYIYVICYSIGYGPIPWILMPELCPREVRIYDNSSKIYVLVNRNNIYS